MQGPVPSCRLNVCSTLLLGQPDWVWIAVVIVGVAAVLLAMVYRQSGWPSRLSLIAGGMKAMAILLIAACFLEPLWSGTRARPGENLTLLIADTSASLQIEDAPGRPSEGNIARWRQFQDALADSELPWQIRLAQDFRVRRYSLSATANAVQTFENIEWTGPRSALGRSLATLNDRYRNHPVAAVLLFTDGLATDSIDPAASIWKDAPPIYPVLPRTIGKIDDVTIQRTAATQSSFEDAPVTIQADVASQTQGNDRLVVRLIDEQGEVVEEQTHPADEDGQPVPFRFQTRPTQPLSFYRVQARSESDANAFELLSEESRTSDARRTSEATLANNQRLICIERDPGPYRVLYVSGRPNWEFKFLRRSLAEDSDVHLVGLIRMAKREAKFEFLGREGESSNPLFRGFRKEGDEETESYDEPVLIALGVKDQRELTEAVGGTVKSRFPRTAEELFRYHAVLLDDIEAEFFTREQQGLLERFVSQRGGGLLMLGGLSSYHHGGWHKSIVRDVLPVYCDRTPPAMAANLLADPPAKFRIQLTRDGWLEPWVRLRRTEEEEQNRLKEMAGFQIVSRVDGIKPAAQMLANVVDIDGRPQPALVAQSYGDGRGAALLIGDMWRWSLQREPGTDDDLAKAWRQTVRWLVADVPQRIKPTLDWTTAGDSDAVALRVRVRNEKFEPQENAAVQVAVRIPGEKEPLELPCEPSLEQPGLFETTYVPRQPGGYTAKFQVTDHDGKPLGESQLGWTHEPQAEEFRRIAVNRELMQELAEATGGEVLTVDDLPAFVESLPQRDVPVTEASTTPLWHSPWMLAVILLLLGGEWGLRRWNGLA